MCGIVGVVSKDTNALKCLIDGLTRLEYRGYDSSGVAYVLDNKVNIKKEVGRIKKLEDSLDFKDSNIGIGHTRWATHGVPSTLNAHPHKVGKITLVHNGIIENFIELKKELLDKGYTFKGETDTEIACAYIDYIYNKEKDMIKTLSKITNIFIGSYAFGILNDDELDKIYAIRNDSPLIVGISDTKNLIASDVPAILNYTNKFIDLDNKEIVILENEKVSIFDKDGNGISKTIHEFDGDNLTIEKAGYETFMLKEIHEEAEIIKKTSKFILDDNNLKDLPDLSKYNQIDIVACGSAYHAGLVGKYYIEKYMNIKVNVEIASEYQYKKNFYTDNTLLIVISQSGETADTKKCVIKANDEGIDTLAIVNVKGSSIARVSKYVLYTLAGVEIAVATTKAYLAQITTLILLAYKYSKEKMNNKILDDINSLPILIEKLINRDYKTLASKLYKKSDIYFIGRGIDYSLCLEGSLKLKEISYIHSEAYAAGELKHGTISLIEEGTPVFVVATDEDLFLKTLSNAKEVKARGANVIIVSNNSDISKSEYDTLIQIPNVSDMLEPILTIVPLQLIAYEVAKLKGCDIDKPKNLAKSVTVE